MHWLLLLALLSSATQAKGGGSAESLNRLSENSLRQQLGSVRSVNVRVAPGKNKSGGDFDYFDVSLDGFSADRLMNAANRAERAGQRDDDNRGNGDDRDARHRDSDDFPLDWQARNTALDTAQIGDILGDILGGNVGQLSSAGRIGRVRLRATNFTFQGARYNSLSADLGEIRFDWRKALRGDFDVESVAPGVLALSLRGDQAARLLSPRLPSLSDVRVRFSSGRALIGAKSAAYGLNVPFEVGARLSVQQNRVMATDFSASVSRLRLPSFVLNELTRGLNPLYDFDPQKRWPLAINLSTAQAGSDVLSMRGGVQWLGFASSARKRRSRDSEENSSDERNRDDRDRDDRDRDDSNDEAPRDTEDRDRDSSRRTPQDILGDIFGR